MPYSIYIEYSFDNLVSKFIEHYFNKTENLNTDLNNLFNNPVIVTQTEGIKKYLYYKLVEEKGIVLNLKTFNLQSFFNEYLRFLYDDDIKCEPKNNRAQKEKTNTKNIIFWYLYSFFFDIAKKEGIEKNKDFEDFIVYLYKFSDLFEQYETYRDFNEWDVLRGINLNELNYEYFENLDNLIKTNEIYDEKFQIELIKLIINSLIEDIKYKSLKILKGKETNIKNATTKIEFPLNTVYLIGFDNIPYFYFLFLKNLSNFVDIHFYFLLPAIYNKNTSDKHKSSLLEFCYKNQRKFLEDFFKFFPENHYNSESCLANFPFRLETLLDSYKYFILTGEKILENNKKIGNDGSIEILSNYTYLRELEVIKDKICKYLSVDNSLKYDDIFILTSDIEKYRPFIESVFMLQEPKLPVLVVDKDNLRDSETHDLIELIFDLLKSKFNKTSFLDLISNEIIMKKYNITFNDIDNFIMLTKNYFWGADFEDLQENSYLNFTSFFIESEFYSNFIGFLSSNSYFDKNSYIKYNDNIIQLNNEIEGDFVNSLEKIYNFYLIIIRFYKFTKNKHTLNEYRDFFEDIFKILFYDMEQNHDQILFYRNKITRFLDEIETAISFYNKSFEIEENKFNANNFTISFDLLINLLLNYLKTYPYSIGYAKGKILFSNISTLRNIPAKIIAVLGLNDSTFPRNSVNPSFDLLAKKPESWDRNIREQDNYLFLETILSTVDYLILSYLGKDPVSNKKRSPSIPVKILQEDIYNNFKILIEEIENPLQPFSRKYFFTGNFETFSIGWQRFFTNFFEKLKIKEKIAYNDNENGKINKLENLSNNTEEKKQNLLTKKINLNDLFNFIENPVKEYLRKVLNIKLSLNDEKIDSEFDDNIFKSNIEQFLKDYIKIMFINLKIKGKSSDQSIKEAIEYIKVKYLKQRGFATEIDFNFYKNETEEVFNLIYNYLIIEKSIINIQDFEVKSVVKEYNFNNYNFKIENNFFVLFENEEPRFLILFKKNDKNKDKTTIQEVFPIIEDYLLKAFWGLDISLAKINEENRSFKNKSKIIRNIYIADLKNAKKFENIDFYEKTILNLINLYDEMIFKKNFIPIMEYELKDIQRFKEDNFINRLKDYWENRLFGKYEYESNDSYISIENYYNKVIFDKYINTDDFIKYKDKILLFFQLLLILSQEA